LPHTGQVCPDRANMYGPTNIPAPQFVRVTCRSGARSLTTIGFWQLEQPPAEEA
jgi:hypothetical protein